MAVVPVPLDPAAGDKLSASTFDAGVRDALSFVMNPPRVRAYDAAGVSCASNTETLLTLNSESYDSDSMHSTSANSSRIQFMTTGTYQVNGMVQWPAATFTGSNIHVRVNSNDLMTGGLLVKNWVFTTARIPMFQFTRFFTAGDYIQAWLLQISGGGTLVTTPGEFATFIEARWVAAT